MRALRAVWCHRCCHHAARTSRPCRLRLAHVVCGVVAGRSAVAAPSLRAARSCSRSRVGARNGYNVAARARPRSARRLPTAAASEVCVGYVRCFADRCGRREGATRAACAHHVWVRSRGCEIGAAGSVRRPRGGSGRAGGGLAVTHGHDGAGRSNGGAPYVPLRPRTRVGPRISQVTNGGRSYRDCMPHVCRGIGPRAFLCVL